MSERTADWVARVISGKTVEERREVLSNVPSHLRKDVESLVKKLWPGEKERRRRDQKSAQERQRQAEDIRSARVPQAHMPRGSQRYPSEP